MVFVLDYYVVSLWCASRWHLNVCYTSENMIVSWINNTVPKVNSRGVEFTLRICKVWWGLELME